MLNLILRAIVGFKPSGIVSVISILFAALILFVPKSALALDAQDCITHVENVTIDNVRYFRITRADRKECDLYMIAKNFSQLGEDGKPLPIQQQLRSIKAANDAFMEGKRGVRPVHSHCVPDSKPWPDQTDTEREMCPAQLVNYYPVTNEVLVPRVPQLSKSEQVKKLSAATCEALSTVPNPSDKVKKILTECQKHFAGITIPPQSTSPEQEQLTQARAEVASLLVTTSKQTQNIEAQSLHISTLSASKRSWTWVAVFFLCAFGLATIVAVHSFRKQSKLQDLANIRKIEMEQRIAEAIEERAGGPTEEAYAAVQQENVELRDSLQQVTHEKTNLSQQLADSEQESESKSAEFTAEIDSLNTQVAMLGSKRDDLSQEVQVVTVRYETTQERLDKLVKEHVELKASDDALRLQLLALYDAERRVRGEHLENLNHSIDLARQVISQLDERYRTAVTNNDVEMAEMHAERLNALQQILTTTVGECEARSLALQRLEGNDPRNANPENFLRVLLNDAENRIDNLASVVQMNLALGKLSDQLASDSHEALEQLAQVRAENSRLLGLWEQLVTGIARGLQIDTLALQGLEPDEQARQIALKVGELKAQRLSQADLQEQNAELASRLNDTMEHNAALRKAMECEPDRAMIAELVFRTTVAEADVTKKERLLTAIQTELADERGQKARLQEAVRTKGKEGLLALEAPELVVLPTRRLMKLVQECVLAMHRNRNSDPHADWEIGSDEALSALNGFLHRPLVSDSGYRLPPKLMVNMGPLMISHVAHEVCRMAQPETARIPSVTPTIAPPPPLRGDSASDLRKQTMQGLGAMRERKMTVPYPPKAPEFDLTRDPDDEGKPTH